MPEGRALDMGVYTNGTREPYEEPLEFEFFNTNRPEVLYIVVNQTSLMAHPFSKRHHDTYNNAYHSPVSGYPL